MKKNQDKIILRRIGIGVVCLGIVGLLLLPVGEFYCGSLRIVFLLSDNGSRDVFSCSDGKVISLGIIFVGILLNFFKKIPRWGGLG